jgi:hypothetical protein
MEANGDGWAISAQWTGCVTSHSIRGSYAWKHGDDFGPSRHFKTSEAVPNRRFQSPLFRKKRRIGTSGKPKVSRIRLTR